MFDDPYAQAFVDAARAELAEPSAADQRTRSELGALLYNHAVVRTRFYDEFLLGAADAGCTQVVLLAAGLATRVFRLPLPGRTRVFELDLPEVLAFLSAGEATDLLEAVGELSAPGSRLFFEQASGADDGPLARATALPAACARRWAALLKSGLGERAPGWLVDHGWDCEIHPRSALASAYGRHTEDSPTGRRTS